MRTLGHWTDRETYDEMREAQHYSPGRVVHYWLNGSEYRHAIGAGTADSVDVFTEAGRVYVVSANSGLSYVGLEAFEDGEPVGDTFCDSAAPNIDYLLGLTPLWRAKRLANWCDL